MKKNAFFKLKISFITTSMMFVSLFLSGTVNAQNWDEIIKLTANDRAQGANFGYSVFISGNYAIVGAPKDPSDANGGAVLDESGAAYIFENVGGVWTQKQKLVASDRANYDYFGWSVSMSGKYAVIGAYFESQDENGENTVNSAGSVYIFEETAGVWSQIQKVVASDREANDYFGYAVSISGDYFVVGAYGEDHNVVGTATLNNAGSAYIFHNTAGTWSQVQKIVASDRSVGDYFGSAVSISGDYILIGAYREAEDVGGANTLAYSGSAYIFHNTAGTWSQTQKIVANDREFDASFGISVAISGDNAVVGAFKESKNAAGGNSLSGAGAAYVFTNNGGTWSQNQKLVASDRSSGDYFGRGVAIFGDKAIVGAYQEHHNTQGQDSVASAGSAYVYKFDSGTWSEVNKIVASDRGEGDNFGFAVGISNEFAIVGADKEAHDVNGGSQLTASGSIYIFEETCTLDNSVAVTGETISANLAGATYQWLDCDNSNAPISGETGQSFTPTITGNYAVEITQNNCTLISACTNIALVGLDDVTSNNFVIAPNPNNGLFTITSNNTIEKVEVYSIVGALVYSNDKNTSSSINIDLQNENKGVYFIKIDGVAAGKVVLK